MKTDYTLLERKSTKYEEIACKILAKHTELTLRQTGLTANSIYHIHHSEEYSNLINSLKDEIDYLYVQLEAAKQELISKKGTMYDVIDK